MSVGGAAEALSNRWRSRGLDALKVLVSVALIAYLFWRIHPRQVAQAARGADYALLAIGLLLYFGAIVLNTVRWSLLLKAQAESVPFAELLRFTFVGLFFGNFLPTNIGGDVVRGYDLARYLHRAEDAAISVLVDRLVGLIAFITSAAAMSLLAVYRWGRHDLLPISLVVWIVCLAALGGLGAMLSRRLRRLVGRLFTFQALARLSPIYERLSQALDAYRGQPMALLQAYIVSLGVIYVSNAVNFLVVQAVHAGIPLAYVFLFNPMIAFAPLIVPSLGGLGVNQGAYDLLYAGLGGVASRPAALAVSLFMQLNIYLGSLPGGVLWLRRRRVLAKAERAQT